MFREGGEGDRWVKEKERVSEIDGYVNCKQERKEERSEKESEGEGCKERLKERDTTRLGR